VSTNDEGAAHAPSVSDRARHLAVFAEHMALGAALRSVRPPADRGNRGGGLRAVFLSPHPASHLGTFARFSRWVPHLERMGCKVEILTPSTDAEYAEYQSGLPHADTRYYQACLRNQWRNIRRAIDADAVVLHRGLFPFSPWQRPTFEKELARLNPRLVYDFYDALWVQREQASRQPSRAGRWLHPRDKIEEIIRLARVVTVSNEQLAEFARRQHDDVRIVPMLLETADYQPRRHEPKSPVTLGWLGSHHNLPRLLRLAPALRRLAERRDIVLRVVAPRTVEIPGVPVESHTHPWTPESEHEDLAALDVGLLPLDDTPDERGKSPYKLLQYLAAGLAVVATPLAMDLSVLKPGECFLPATNEDEWVECMTQLVDDAALRGRLGSAGRRAVVDHYSFEGHAESFFDVLATASGHRDSNVPAAARSS
jgi:glycosyltransferase involved in cell wall biosynthesis